MQRATIGSSIWKSSAANILLASRTDPLLPTQAITDIQLVLFYMYSGTRTYCALLQITGFFFLVSTDAARDRTVPKIEGCRKKKKKKKINPLRRGKRNVLRLVHIDRAFSHVFPKYQCLLVLSTLPGKSKRPCHIGNLMRNVGGTIPVFVIVLYPFLFWHW